MHICKVDLLGRSSLLDEVRNLVRDTTKQSHS
jgi:hypothetical protein